MYISPTATEPIKPVELPSPREVNRFISEERELPPFEGGVMFPSSCEADRFISLLTRSTAMLNELPSPRKVHRFIS